jgi:hypothetical protein
VLRIVSPLSGNQFELALRLAGGAFGLFAVFYGGALARSRVRDELAKSI